MLGAAHNGDLANARKCGLMTGFFPAADGVWPTPEAGLCRRPGLGRDCDGYRGHGDETWLLMQQGATMASDLHEIEQVLQTYFDGVYEGNTAKLAKAFHEEAHLFGVRGRQAGRHVARAVVRFDGQPPSRADPRPATTRLGGADRPLGPEYSLREGALPDFRRATSPTI